MKHTIQTQIERFKDKFYKPKGLYFWGTSDKEDLEAFLKTSLESVWKEAGKEMLKSLKAKLKNSFTVAGLPAETCSKWDIVKKEVESILKQTT